MLGKSTLGRSLTGSRRYAKTPNTRIAAITSTVAIGRFMKSAAIFIPAPQLMTHQSTPGLTISSDSVLLLQRAVRAGVYRRLRAPALDFHLRPVLQPDLPVSHDLFAGRKPLTDNRVLTIGPGDRHRPFFGCLVPLPHITVLPLLAVLHSDRRHRARVGLYCQSEHDVYKLSGPQPMVLVRICALQLDGPGGRINCVVDER